MTVSAYARSPEDTLAAIDPWLKKCGVSRLADLTDMDSIRHPGLRQHPPRQQVAESG